MSPITIQAAESPADFDILRDLLREYGAHLVGSLGPRNICMQRYEQELAGLPSPYKTLLLARAGEQEVAGCVLLKPIPGTDDSAPHEKPCELKRLWVRPQFRGGGVGRKLTESAIAEAIRQGYTAMYLDTVPSVMQAAHRMYEELGFKSIGRYNDNAVSNVAFFRLRL